MSSKQSPATGLSRVLGYHKESSWFGIKQRLCHWLSVYFTVNYKLSGLHFPHLQSEYQQLPVECCENCVMIHAELPSWRLCIVGTEQILVFFPSCPYFTSFSKHWGILRSKIGEWGRHLNGIDPGICILHLLFITHKNSTDSFPPSSSGFYLILNVIIITIALCTSQHC